MVHAPSRCVACTAACHAIIAMQVAFRFDCYGRCESHLSSAYCNYQHGLLDSTASHTIHSDSLSLLAEGFKLVALLWLSLIIG
jgi:hypothetical protein